MSVTASVPIFICNKKHASPFQNNTAVCTLKRLVLELPKNSSKRISFSKNCFPKTKDSHKQKDKKYFSEIKTK